MGAIFAQKWQDWFEQHFMGSFLMGSLRKVLANLRGRAETLEITVPNSRKKGLSYKCANYPCRNYPLTSARLVPLMHCVVICKIFYITVRWRFVLGISFRDLPSKHIFKCAPPKCNQRTFCKEIRCHGRPPHCMRTCDVADKNSPKSLPV